MKKAHLLILFLSINFGCGLEKNSFSINELYIGFSSYDAFKIDKRDSLEFIAPPPPCFEENIANNNFIESEDGKVFFYSFPAKEPLCGFITKNKDYKFELYYPELDSLKEENLKAIDENNLNTVLDSIIHRAKPIFVSIGLQNDSSKNKILLKITNQLYQNSYNNVWKVRSIDPKEKKLLSE